MKKDNQINRRDFIKKAGAMAGTVAIAGYSDLARAAEQPVKNAIPRWKGFNFLDFFSPREINPERSTPEEYFKWMSDWGFDFVRIPMAYPSYVKFNRSKPITTRRVRKIDRKATDVIENLVYLANKHNLHVSLNLHRAPGFCVNAGFEEPYNLWQDEEAMEDFCYHWKFWAKTFKNVSPEKLSFDLLNEPCVREDMNDQHSKRGPIPGHMYRRMAEMAANDIRRYNPDRLIVADGNNIGRDVIPEITDLNIAQSCRGYEPAIISHYQAGWVFKDSSNLPQPLWPGQVGDQYLSRQRLEDFYQPWIDLVKSGVGVHCGECGCYNKTPHKVFLSWFDDVLDILTSNDIGYALWEFKGNFGILDSGREDVEYEDWYGHKLDRKLLTLLQKYA